jgi:voltage-gated potassium channel Kch
MGVYEIFWNSGFEASLVRIGITFEVFERLGRFGVCHLLQTDPYEQKSTFTLDGTASRYLHTRFRFPDLPAMVIAYDVNDATRTVTVLGAEEVWQDDLDPYSPDPYSPEDLPEL